ncbi:MAG: hypothetical protein HEP71_03595 [Roseivirga sp.]|nr:hypothetical protein [Roseivirga sp.]
MKKVLNLKNSVAFLMLLGAMVTFMAMDKAPAYDPTGTWNYEIETPDGAISGDMSIAKTDGEFEVSVETDDFGTLELEDVEVKDNEMTASVDVQGVTAEFEVEFDGDEMSGIILYGGEELPIVAEREKSK